MKMKRTLSLVLALVMVLGTFGTVFAETVVETPETNVAAGALLKDLGVLVGNAEGDLMLEEGLKRQDAVILLAKLMGEFDAAAEFPTVKGEIPTYEDIEDHFYLPFLAWAQANKTFVGHTPAKFGFDDQMTVQEYAKVLLTVLGHEVGPDADVKWEDVMDTAFDLGLVDTTEEVGFTRGVMAMMTYNALNTKMKDSDQTLAEFLDIEMPEVEAPEAEELKIEKVYTENLAEVVVELSNAKLVKNARELENEANYTIAGAKVYSAKLDGNNVTLTLVPHGLVSEQANVNGLVKGNAYKVTVRNIAPELNKTYSFTAEDNGIPTVETVEFMGTQGIKVTTSEPVNNPQERNFRVGDKRTAMVIEQYGRELILTPYHSASFDKDATELVVEGLEDFARYKSVKTVEEMELETDVAKPVVKAAYRSGDKLTVVFEEDIYMNSVEAKETRRDLGNVSFVERRVTFHADDAKKIDTNVAVYTFEREIPRDVEVLIEGVQNHSKVAMERTEILPTLFVDEYAPVVISDLNTTIRTKQNEVPGLPTNETTGLKIVFDKDIEEFKTIKVGDDVSSFFNLYQVEVSLRGQKDAENIDVKVAAIGKDSITLDFDKIVVNNKNRDYDYVLEVKNFTDLTGNRMEREYIDFQVLPSSTAFDVKNISVKQVNKFNREDIEIKLAFTGYVDQASAEEATNYYINDKLAVDEAIVERDGVTVTLVIRDMTYTEFIKAYGKEIDKVTDKQIILEVSPRVKNLAKNAQVANRFWDLRDLDNKVSALEAAITSLKPVANLTIADVADVNAAEALYNALTKSEEALVDSNLVKKLKDSIKKVEELVASDGELTVAKGLLQTAINNAVLSAAELDDNTTDSVALANAYLLSAKDEAQTAHDALDATVDSIEAAIVTLANKVTAAKAKLEEKAEAVMPTGLTVATSDDTILVITATGLKADATVTQVGLTVDSITPTADTITVVLKAAATGAETGVVTVVVQATNTHKEGTFEFDLTRTTANTWTFVAK